MSELPTGTVTFLFTDIEGSTALLETLGDGYRAIQDRHDEIIRNAIAAGGGVEVRTEGDAFFAVFETANGAINAALAAQRGLADATWPTEERVRVRMGVHTGEGVLGGADYVGIDVHRAARIAASAHGGQVLVSEATRGLAGGMEGIDLVDLGEHRFKGLTNPERLYQLSAPGLDRDFPLPRSLDARPNNLPDRLSSFIGRDDEIELIIRLLAENRLVTLTGPGGTGKTRLALEVAANTITDFSDGAFFVDLAAVTDPGFIAATAADALGVRQRADRPPEEVLADALGSMSLLLVFDNFEQVIDGAPLIAGLLQRAPAVKAMATSRVPLHVEGEQEVPIEPLDCPSVDGNGHLEDVLRYEAIRLFVDRARSAKPGFELTEDNAPSVAAITVRLDGLPLAIELAASRVKLFTPSALLDQLESSLPLAAKATDIPERQRTLRSTIGWSYDLLDDGEARLFNRLGAFVGGADLEAVSAVGADLPDVIEAVESLVDRSLIRMAEGPDGAPRAAMLETIREFAAERLAESGEEDDVRRALMEHWIEVVESAELIGPDQMLWLRRLDLEQDNLRAGLQWALDRDETELGLRLATGLRYYGRAKGTIKEGLRWLEAFLLASEGDPPSLQRARALTAAADLYSPGRGQRELNLKTAKQALAAYRELGNETGVADALVELSYAQMGVEDYASARETLLEATALTRRIGYEQKLAEATAIGAIGAMAEGDLETARSRAEEARAWFAENDPFFVTITDLFLGQLDRLDGNVDGALARYRESLAVYEQMGNPMALAFALYGLAGIAAEEGEYERAVLLRSGFQAISDDAGTEPPEFAATLFGDAAEAARPHLDPAVFEEAWGEGQSMSREELAEYASRRF